MLKVPFACISANSSPPDCGKTCIMVQSWLNYYGISDISVFTRDKKLQGIRSPCRYPIFSSGEIYSRNYAH